MPIMLQYVEYLAWRGRGRGVGEFGLPHVAKLSFVVVFGGNHCGESRCNHITLRLILK